MKSNREHAVIKICRLRLWIVISIYFNLYRLLDPLGLVLGCDISPIGNGPYSMNKNLEFHELPISKGNELHPTPLLCKMLLPMRGPTS